MKLLSVLISLSIFAINYAQRFGARQGQYNCITPENNYGSCITLSFCPEVVNIFQRTRPQVARQYLFALQRACGTRNINGDPVICCARSVSTLIDESSSNEPSFETNNKQSQTTPSQNPFLENPRTTTSPPTIKSTTRSTTTIRSVTSAAITDGNASYCRDPNGTEGVCKEIANCPQLVTELYAKQNDASFANFLRLSNVICGKTGSIVCCTPSTETTSTMSQGNDSNEIPRRPPSPEEGCGYSSNVYKKIVGGQPAKKGSWPWIALIGYDDDLSNSPFKCGGTLVTARHVVTAAHCIRSDLSFVRLGEHDLETETEAQTVDVKVVKKISHPEYNKNNGRADIAVLFLERNIKFTVNISPICLPVSAELRRKSYVKFSPFVAGWGKTMMNGRSASVLHELQIPILENEECKNRYAARNRLFSQNQFDSAVICAGVLAGGKDTCQGDSGGPLMIPEPYQNSVRYYLLGVVSYGIGCAQPEIPGVYSSIQYFIDWILQKISDGT